MSHLCIHVDLRMYRAEDPRSRPNMGTPVPFPVPPTNDPTASADTGISQSANSNLSYELIVVIARHGPAAVVQYREKGLNSPTSAIFVMIDHHDPITNAKLTVQGSRLRNFLTFANPQTDTLARDGKSGIHARLRHVPNGICHMWTGQSHTCPGGVNVRCPVAAADRCNCVGAN